MMTHPLWLAQNLMNHPFVRAQNLVTHPPILIDQSLKEHHLKMSTCPQHREAYGIRWRCQKK